MEIIGIEEVMKLLGVGRPTLPRKKGQTFKVDKAAFLAWVKKEAI